MPIIERTCERCGKLFLVYPSVIKVGGGKYCSKKCYQPALVKEGICAHCCKTFLIDSKHKTPPRKYCSMTCYRLARSHPELCRERVCQRCGKTFTVYPNILKLDKGKFCSAECANPSSKVERVCLQCGEKFIVHMSKVMSGGGKFCSFSCRSKYNARISRDELSIKIKELWKDPEYVAKTMKGQEIKPNRPESRVIAVCKNYFPDFKYNGDYSLGVSLAGLIPDLVNTNGKKEVIEIFGEFWHGPKRALKWQRTELGRIMAYNSVGFRCLVIWDNELDKLSEDQLVDKIASFTGEKNDRHALSH
jgi:hypothetical protein